MANGIPKPCCCTSCKFRNPALIVGAGECSVVDCLTNWLLHSSNSIALTLHLKAAYPQSGRDFYARGALNPNPYIPFALL